MPEQRPGPEPDDVMPVGYAGKMAVFPVPPTKLKQHERIQEARLTSLVRADVIRPVGTAGEALANYLDRCEEIVCQEIIEDVGAYSKAQWLWYLRRIDDRVYGRGPDSNYHRNLAEVITGLGGAASSSQVPTKNEYPYTEETVDSVCRLAGSVKYLSKILWLKRILARGLTLAFTDDPALPSPIGGPAYTPALQLYHDRRLKGANSFLSKAGTELTVRARGEDVPLGILVPSRIGVTEQEIEGHGRHGRTIDRISQSYADFWFSIDRVSNLARHLRHHTSWPSNEFWSLALGLRLTSRLVPSMRAPWLSFLQFSYVSVDYDYLIELFDSVWSNTISEFEGAAPRALLPRNAAAVGEFLQQPCGSVLPLRLGPVIRLDRNLALLDICAAVSSLEATIVFPVEQGRSANVRSGHFETAIQQIIDTSPWRPPSALRELRGRALRHNGQALTDVDAIAAKNHRVLIVSAKSVAASPDYEAGSYRASRNTATTVLQACDDARRVRNTLVTQPKGDNFDFSRYFEIEVVVCTPYLIYVPLGPATVAVYDGLRAAVTLAELNDFLTGRVP